MKKKLNIKKPITVKAVAKKQPKAKKAVPQRRNKIASVAPQPTAVVPVEETKKLAIKKRMAKKNESLADKIAAARDAPHIEARLRVGELAVPVDPRSLERTLGTGMWSGRGLVDAWPDTAWAGLLAHLGLPAFPLDRKVAEQPVKRFVQRLWYEAIDCVHSCHARLTQERAMVFTARDAEKAEQYKTDFPKIEGEVTAKKERAKTSFGRKPGDETRYTPTDKLKDKKLVLGGQQAPLLAFFKTTKFAPATTAEATAGMLEHGLKTTTDPARISSFYLSQWTTKKGYLTR